MSLHFDPIENDATLLLTAIVLYNDMYISELAQLWILSLILNLGKS